MALAGGITAFMAQQEAGATGEVVFSFNWRMLFGFYGIMMYVVKLILPFGLAPIYPYPVINQNLPAEYYAGPVFFNVLATLFVYGLKKTGRWHSALFFTSPICCWCNISCPWAALSWPTGILISLISGYFILSAILLTGLPQANTLELITS